MMTIFDQIQLLTDQQLIDMVQKHAANEVDGSNYVTLKEVGSTTSFWYDNDPPDDDYAKVNIRYMRSRADQFKIIASRLSSMGVIVEHDASIRSYIFLYRTSWPKLLYLVTHVTLGLPEPL